MSDVTFEQLWRSVMVYFPECPLPLAQQFVNNAYSNALAKSRWAGQRGDAAFVLPAPYDTGTITVTAGSATVTGTGTDWDLFPLQVLAGMQVVANGQGPFGTILTVDDATTITLDATWQGATLTDVPYTIQQIYLTPASDLASFLSVIDIQNNWKLHLTFSQEQLDYFDGQRNHSGTPFILAGGVSFTSGGRPRWEIWPRPGDAKVYPYHYIKRLPLLSAASDRPIFPFRGDVLREGIFAELALWPGTKQLKNPYFDMQQHQVHRELFTERLKEVQRDDQELAQTMITYHDNVPFAPFDAAWLQGHGGWPFI